MQWEHLTAQEFAEAVRQTGVCIIAMGVVEKHSEHLPLGTDFLNGHKLACLAAEKEPAVVFPPFYFGQIYEARCFPGTITLKPTLLLELLLGVLDEIGRNGFGKHSLRAGRERLRGARRGNPPDGRTGYQGRPGHNRGRSQSFPFHPD